MPGSVNGLVPHRATVGCDRWHTLRLFKKWRRGAWRRWPRCAAPLSALVGRFITPRRPQNQFETEEAERSLHHAFIPNGWGTARCKVPNIAAAARKKLRLALLMTDDGNLATRLRTLVEKYRVRALIAEQRVLEVPTARSRRPDRPTRMDKE